MISRRLKGFFRGLMIGLCLSSLVLLWASHDWLRELEYEQDRNQSLGLQTGPVPKVALKRLSPSVVAQKLRLRDETLAFRLTEAFVDRVSAGFLPNRWSQTCLSELHPALCSELDRYFSWTKDVSRRQIRSRTRRIAFSSQNIPELQSQDLGHLLSRVSKVRLSQLQEWSKASLKTTTCPRHASVALARMWEFHLSEKDGGQQMHRLDAHGAECLERTDEHYEYVKMRMALWDIKSGKLDNAEALLTEALGAEKPREPYRVRYWLARVKDQKGDSESAKELRHQIRQNYPLSWYAIEASLDDEVDPLGVILERNSAADQRFTGTLGLDASIAWLYMMVHYYDQTRGDREERALQKYAEYIYERLDETTDPGVYQHIARAYDSVGQYRLQIRLLRKLFLQSSENITTETLRLYYPRPFFQIIQRSTPTLDTAVLLGLARQESGFDPKARSGANARGLLQLLPSTAREIRRKTRAADLYVSEINVELGAIYFKRLLRYFGGSFEKSLAAYNAGMGRVRQWERAYEIEDTRLFLSIMPYRETREYVPSILRNAYWYHRLFPEVGLDFLQGAETAELLEFQLNRSPRPEIEEVLEEEAELTDVDNAHNADSGDVVEAEIEGEGDELLSEGPEP